MLIYILLIQLYIHNIEHIQNKYIFIYIYIDRCIKYTQHIYMYILYTRTIYIYIYIYIMYTSNIIKKKTYIRYIYIYTIYYNMLYIILYLYIDVQVH